MTARGEKILIAGATGGIGRAVAAEAARRGYECVLVARDWAAVEAVRAALPQPELHKTAVVDFANVDSLELDLMRIFTAEGPLNAVVYAVGTCPVKPLALLGGSFFEETIRVGCTGFVMMMKAFAAQGAHTRRAAAVAVSSVSAGEGWPGGAAYCAAKGALSAVARALDAELSPKGIRVAALEPRYVLTRMFRDCAGRMGVPEAAAMPPETFAQEVMDRVESGLRGA